MWQHLQFQGHLSINRLKKGQNNPLHRIIMQDSQDLDQDVEDIDFANID